MAGVVRALANPFASLAGSAHAAGSACAAAHSATVVGEHRNTGQSTVDEGSSQERPETTATLQRRTRLCRCCLNKHYSNQIDNLSRSKLHETFAGHCDSHKMGRMCRIYVGLLSASWICAMANSAADQVVTFRDNRTAISTTPFVVTLSLACGTGVNWRFVPDSNFEEVSSTKSCSAQSREPGETGYQTFILNPKSPGDFELVWLLRRPGSEPYRRYLLRVHVDKGESK